MLSYFASTQCMHMVNVCMDALPKNDHSPRVERLASNIQYQHQAGPTVNPIVKHIFDQNLTANLKWNSRIGGSLNSCRKYQTPDIIYKSHPRPRIVYHRHGFAQSLHSSPDKSATQTCV